MTEDILQVQNEAVRKVEESSSLEDLEAARLEYLGKKGRLTSWLHQLGALPAEEKRSVGALVNNAKARLESLIAKRRALLSDKKREELLQNTPPLDLSLPGMTLVPAGSVHPVSRVIEDAVGILTRVGFSVTQGPEVESDVFHFEALNIPADHPARDAQDTFYLSDSLLLRAHTSPVQVRFMQEKAPPLQMITYGRVYRADYDATHTPMFHQIEGLMVDKKISMGDLKGILAYLFRQLMGPSHLRFRPSYFPFTEPSAEVDLQCVLCRRRKEADCKLCHGSGWLEVGGCGMVHPNVFRAAHYPPDAYTGFAFGLGVERLAMIKYGIDDLRSLFENDLRVLEQF